MRGGRKNDKNNGKGSLKSENCFCRGGYFGIQNRRKWPKMPRKKMSKKWAAEKTTCLMQCSVFGWKNFGFWRILGSFLGPCRHAFSLVFWASVLGWISKHFWWKTSKRPKMRKWLSHRKIHAIVRVAKSKKKGTAVEKCDVFFINFSWKNQRKSSWKVRKTEIH